MWSNERHVDIAGAGMARIVRRVIPEPLEVLGHEGADGLWHLPEVIGEIAQGLHGLEQYRDTVAIHIAAAGGDQGVFSRTQEKVLNEFLMGVRGFDPWIVACHTHPTATMNSDCPEAREPVLWAPDQDCMNGMEGDFNAEMPVQKSKTEITLGLRRA